MDNAYAFSGICRDYLKASERRISLIRDMNYVRPEDMSLYEEREDAEFDTSNFQMAMYVFIKNGEGWCAVVSGYTYDYHVIVGKKGENYYMYPRFYLDGAASYEDIRVEFHQLSGKDADYSGIARAYRNICCRTATADR